MKHLISKKRLGFSSKSLHQQKEPSAMFYMKQRISFWVATLSLIAFVTGNMMGQHGWHAFWKSVLGKTDDSLIVYVGTTSPIAKVPDFEKWAEFGGDPNLHTFRQVPENVLIPLPKYDAREQSRTDVQHWAGEHVYSVGFMGSYNTGAEMSGSHPGVDIRTPVGTPIVSIANGIVDEVKDDPGGFGKVVVIRHPNVPNPSDPSKTTTLYSSYAHLNAVYVTTEEIVYKAQHIADSGKTGFVSGPHLHFQIDSADAPWHPFWPFTGSEIRSAGLTTTQAINSGFHQATGLKFTVNPLLYVQANYPAIKKTTVLASADLAPIVNVHESAPEPKLSLAERATQRRESRLVAMFERTQDRLVQRLAKWGSSDAPAAPIPSAVATVSQPVVAREEVVSADPTPIAPPVTPVPSSVDILDISHDGSYSGRDWEVIRVTLKDSLGNSVPGSLLQQDLYMRTAYGSAEFRPEILSPLDFKDGVAQVQMLPRGNRTIVIQVQPFATLSRPMTYGE